MFKMNGDINESEDLELTVTDSLNDKKLNGNSHQMSTNNKSNSVSFNFNNNCDNHQLNSLNGVTDNGNGYVPIVPRKQHSYNLNSAQKQRRCSTCATKLCIFCTGFIIGLLLSIILLSALQYLNEKSPKKYYNESRSNESSIAEEIRENKNFGPLRPQITPSGRSLKNFTQSNDRKTNGYPIYYNNKSSVSETKLSNKTPEVITAKPEINDIHQRQGHKEEFDELDERIPLIVPESENFTFNSSISEETTTKPELITEKVIEVGGDRNSPDLNNYNEINKLITPDGNQANNVLTTTTVRTIDLKEGNNLLTTNMSDGNIGLTNYNNSLITVIPDYRENVSLIDNEFVDNYDFTTPKTINNYSETVSKTVNIIGTDLEETQTQTQTPTEANDLTSTEKSIQLLKEFKSLPNQTDSVLSSTTSENIITTVLNYGVTNDNETPTSISGTSFTWDEDLNDSKKPNLNSDPFIPKDVTTDGMIQLNNDNISEVINTTEPVFADVSTPSLISTETVTEGSTSLASTTITYTTTTTSDLSYPTTISHVFNDTLDLNLTETTPNSIIMTDPESNDTLLVRNQNQKNNNRQNLGFNSTENNDNNNDFLEFSSNTTTNFPSNSTTITSSPIFLEETNQTITTSIDNSTESMPPILNISLTIPQEVYCLSTQFSCPNESHRCLDNDLICNGVIDCPLDGFDERECGANNCSANFKCGNYDLNTTDVKCISRQSYCDGIWDCEDGSDELGCHLEQCQKGEFLCKDGSACIKGKQACDFTFNCPDHSDEIGCVSRTSCETMGRFYCDDGLCIERSLRCDGIVDCRNGTDELNCVSRADCSSIGHYFCDNGNCIERSKRCNGINECGDSSDEYECVRNDEKGVVQVYNPLTDSWSVLCAKTNFETSDADRICHRFGYLRSINYTLLNVKPLNTSWADDILEPDYKSGPIHSSVCDSNQTVSVFCDNFKCGHNQRGQDIGNNTDDKSSEDVPPGLTLVNSDGRVCPAQIIAAKWLITSAQCIKNFSVELTQIKSTESLIDVKISKIQIHSHYSKFRSLRFSDYDIALVETNRILNISETNTVCLPAHQIDPAITCFVGTPFGDHRFGDIPYEVIEKQVCNSSKHFNKSLTSRHFCANTNTQRSISSIDNKRCVPNGSALICLSSSSHWYIAGFASYQHGCNGSHIMGRLTHPTVFSNVYSMKSFIEKAIGIKQYLIQTDYPLYAENYIFNYETTTHLNSDSITNSSINYENLNQTMDSNYTESINQTESLKMNENFSTTENFVLTKSFNADEDSKKPTEYEMEESFSTTESSNMSDSFTIPELNATDLDATETSTSDSLRFQNSDAIENLTKSLTENENKENESELTLPINVETDISTENSDEMMTKANNSTTDY